MVQARNTEKIRERGNSRRKVALHNRKKDNVGNILLDIVKEGQMMTSWEDVNHVGVTNKEIPGVPVLGMNIMTRPPTDELDMIIMIRPLTDVRDMIITIQPLTGVLDRIIMIRLLTDVRVLCMTTTMPSPNIRNIIRMIPSRNFKNKIDVILQGNRITSLTLLHPIRHRRHYIMLLGIMHKWTPRIPCPPLTEKPLRI